MGKIQGASSRVEADVDSASLALRQSNYDKRGQYIGMKPTYSASTTLKTATAAGTGVFASIYGSASKVVRIQRITICGTVATTAVYGDVVIKKVTTPGTGGTATALTQVSMDSNNPASTATGVNYYTVLRTAGSGGGALASKQHIFPVTATAAINAPLIFDWLYESMLEAPTLRGTNEGIEINFGTTTTNAPTLTVTIEWTEDVD